VIIKTMQTAIKMAKKSPEDIEDYLGSGKGKKE
jgi:hypothetical protein